MFPEIHRVSVQLHANGCLPPSPDLMFPHFSCLQSLSCTLTRQLHSPGKATLSLDGRFCHDKISHLIFILFFQICARILPYEESVQRLWRKSVIFQCKTRSPIMIMTTQGIQNEYTLVHLILVFCSFAH